MKIRNGFVSNSSSSSYIVEIHGITLDAFINILYMEYSWSQFDYDTIKKEVDNEYEKTKALASAGSRFYGLRDEWVKSVEEKREKLIEATTSHFEFTKFVLWLRGIKITEKPNSIELYSWTSMHNDFGDMPELLNEIVLYFIMDTTHTVTGKRISEG